MVAALAVWKLPCLCERCSSGCAVTAREVSGSFVTVPPDHAECSLIHSNRVGVW